MRKFPGASLCLALGFAATTASAGQPASVQLTLKETAVVAARYLTVADLMEVEAQDVALKTSVQQLRVARTPRVGYVEQYSREELYRALRARVLPAAVVPQWAGASHVLVQASGQVVDMPALLAVAAGQLHQQLEGKFQEVALQPAATPAELAVPHGEVTFQARPVEMRRIASRFAVRVDVLVDGEFYQSVVVPFSVQARKQALIARHDLMEGAAISLQDFEVGSVDALAVSDEVVDPAQVVAVDRIRKAMRKGQSLASSNLVAKNAVVRGDVIKLVVSAGNVDIEAEAIAQQDGEIGQAVVVRMERGSAAVTGRVIAAGVVRVIGG